MSKNKDFHEQCINYVNKHNLSPLSLKIYRIIYLIIAAVFIYYWNTHFIIWWDNLYSYWNPYVFILQVDSRKF